MPPTQFQYVRRMIGRPIGVSLLNGQGISGILCDIQGDTIYVMEYLYHTQFAMKHYTFDMIEDIHPFPPCKHSPSPRPRPRIF